MGSDCFYLAKVCDAYYMVSRVYVVPIKLALTGFYLAREYVVPIICSRPGFTFDGEYVVPIICVRPGFILPESMWCLLSWL